LNMNNTLFMDRFTVYEMIIINSIHKTKNGPFLLIIHIFRQSIIFQCPYLHRYKDSIHFPLSAHEHFMQYRKHGASNGTQHLHFHQAKYLGFTILKEPMIFAHIWTKLFLKKYSWFELELLSITYVINTSFVQQL
jgi:hypothetical protein